MLDNWHNHDECSPWREEDSYYIVVDSEYESPGYQKEYRLNLAKYDGIVKLLQFYGKLSPPVLDTTELFDNSETPDYFVSYKPCVLMKVLVKVPQSIFDQVDDDVSACDIIRPEEGYLEASISVYDYAAQIEFVVDIIESYLPALARSSKFISNINILAELKRLRRASNIINRYLNRNRIMQQRSQFEACEPEIDRRLIIGYTYEYKGIYALIEGEQHTIGYDCFINNDVINHLTTANYLLHLDAMHEHLMQRDINTFNIFAFLTRFTLPTPVIRDKEKRTDGLSLYADKGISFGFADLAKLISLDIDINLCKSDEELAEEDRLFNLDPETRRNLRDSASQLKKLKGDMSLSSENVQSLTEKFKNIGGDVPLDSTVGKEALRTLYGDVLSKIDIACMVNEALQCYIDRTISLVGESIVEGDEDLGELIDVSLSLGKMVNARCGFEKCNFSPDIDISVGFPIFQGIQIPDNFPTLDYLAEIIEKAIEQLYAALVKALSDAILRILQNSCEVIFDDALGEGIGAAAVKAGFQDWLGESIGVSFEDLNDPKAWGDALTSAGGTGFIGAVGNMVSRGISSGLAVYEDTGVALNLPTSEKGWAVEEVLVSPEAMTGFLSDLRNATSAVTAVTSPDEQILLYQGTASEETLTVAYKCLKAQNPAFGSLFKDKYEFADMFSSMGRMIKPEFLEYAPDPAKTPPKDFCHLGDGTDATILREALLAEKDSQLTQDEIAEIINKEVEHNTEKIRTLYNTLKTIMNGTMAPSFPSLFGQSDSLIPELPPAMKEVIATAIEGPLGVAMSNFNYEVARYPNIYERLYADDYGWTPKELFGAAFKATSKCNLPGDPGDLSDRDYTIGYDIINNQPPIASAVSERIEGEVFEYDFGKDVDVGGSPADITSGHARKYGDMNIDENGVFYILSDNTAGEDDSVFEQMLQDTGFDNDGMPVVLKKHPSYNRYADAIFAGFQAEGVPDYRAEFLDAYVSDWYFPLQWVELIDRIDGSYVRDLTPEDLELESNATEMTFPDRAYGYYPSGIRVSQYSDPSVEWNIGWETYGNKGKYIKMQVQKITYEVTAGEQTPVVRSSGFSDKLVKVHRRSAGASVVDYKDEAYNISSSPNFLGRKVATGKLAYRRFSTLGDTPALRMINLNNLSDDILGITLSGLGGLVLQSSFSVLTAFAEVIGGAMGTDFTRDYGLERQLAEKVIDDITVDIFDQFARHIGDGKYSIDPEPTAAEDWTTLGNESGMGETSFDTITPTYPAADILGYEELKSFATDLSTELLSLTTKTESEQRPILGSYPSSATEQEIFCDNISPGRRASAIVSTILLTRLFIVEQAMIAIHICNAFDLSFMDSELFVSSVYKSIKNELEQYTVDFETIHGKLFDETKMAALKYYDFRRITEDPQLPQNPGGKYALKEIIRKEIDTLRGGISAALHVPLSGKSWDEFLTEKIFGVINQGDTLTEDEWEAALYDLDTIIKWKDRYVTKDDDASGALVPRFIFETLYDPTTHIMGFQLSLLTATQTVTSAGEEGTGTPRLTTSDYFGSFKEVETNLGDKVILLRTECEQAETFDPSDSPGRAEEIWNNLKQEMWDLPEYKELFYYLLPIQDMVSALSLYEFAALSDTAVFKEVFGGINLHDMLARTKLSILQALTSAVYGFQNLSYEDPFLKKSGIS